MKQLETIDDDAEKFSVDFVKVIDKRLAKQYHVQTFPTLTMFRDGEMTPFIGDLTNAAQVKYFFLFNCLTSFLSALNFWNSLV